MSYVFPQYEHFVLFPDKCIHSYETIGNKCNLVFENGDKKTIRHKKCDDLNLLPAYFSKVDYRCYQDVNNSIFGIMPNNNDLYLKLSDYFFLMSLLGIFIGYVTLRGLK